MLIVSNYHYIREDFNAPFPSIFGNTPKQFKSQLEKLSQFGQFISQEELLANPDGISKDNYFLVTFDDGLKEQFDLAKPILEEMGIPYIFFINTSNFSSKKVSLVHKIHLLRSLIDPTYLLNLIEKMKLTNQEKKAAIKHYNYDQPENAILKYMLNFKFSFKEQQEFIEPLFENSFNEEEVAKELYFTDSMLEILYKDQVLGSHSHSHRPLGLLEEPEIDKELKLTQEFFQERFGKPARSISFPYGSYDSCEGLTPKLSKAGFQLGFSMERAANESLQSESLLLSRFDCNDLPGGKNDLFNGKDPFKSASLRKWHLNENSIFNK